MYDNLDQGQPGVPRAGLLERLRLAILLVANGVFPVTVRMRNTVLRLIDKL